ncbi:MAG TPA: GGDEF domain-containing phosphodiesterase [Caulobacteraceae bacterium]|jgi:EAL domain-containing protein (putative c-di-GMP-specific phosphodiesterase class I)
MSQFLGFVGRPRVRGGPTAARTSTPPEHPSPPGAAVLDRERLELRITELAGAGDGRPLFVAAFGLDRFDRMRGVIGYAVAGEIVLGLAERLQKLQPEWVVARASDDVLMAAFEAADDAVAERRVEAVRQALQGAHAIGQRQVDIRLTVGLSDAGPPGALMREADVALDAARSQRVPLKVFDMGSHAAAAGAISLMPELRGAITNGQLFLAHQPQRNLRTGAIEGVESLVRWTHPLHGPVPPDAFVQIAEETGDIRAMTHWVIDRALAEQRGLARAGHQLPFSVNLSARLVSDDAFIEWVLQRRQPGDGVLRLEITETAVIEHPARAFANVARLAAAGIACSIDDYGAGLSSIAYLKRIEADELKLDKSLVDEIVRSRRDAVVTRSLIDLAHGLGMKVVAEGVEDAKTAAVVASLGCDLGQGFYFGRPMPLPSLIELLDAEAKSATAGVDESDDSECGPPLRSAL